MDSLSKKLLNSSFDISDLPIPNIPVLSKIFVLLYSESNETKTCHTSLRLYQLPLTFTISLQLKMLIKANNNQQMYSTSYSTAF